MTDSQPWWARPGGAPTPGSPDQGAPQQPGGQQPYWSPNAPSSPPAQGNPYGGSAYGGAPQQQYGQQNPGAGAPPAWQGGGYHQPQAPANPYQPQGYEQQGYGQQGYGQQGYPNQQQYPYQQPTGAPKGKPKWLLIGVPVVVVVLIGGGLLTWLLVGGSKKSLDVNAAQTGVKQILSDPINGYGSNNVTSVNCNDGKNPTVAKGGTFTCKVKIDDNEWNVNVEFTDDEGTYAVDGPR